MRYFKLLLAVLLTFEMAAAFAQIAPSQGIVILQPTVETATTVNSQDYQNYFIQGGISSLVRGGHFILNVSAYTSGNYTVHIQGKDPVSSSYYDVLVSPAISSTGLTILKVYPGIAAIANGAAADILPATWRVQLIGASSPSMTVSIAAVLE